MMNSKEAIKEFYNQTAAERAQWNKRNRFYHKSLERYFSLIIPEGKRVIELGCGFGDLLNAVKPAYGAGIDFSENAIDIARRKHPHLHFTVADVEELNITEKFDYVIISDLLSGLWDVQQCIRCVHQLCTPDTRIVISQYNFAWEPLIKFAQFAGLKQKQFTQSWFSVDDVNGLLSLEGFELVTVDRRLLLPVYIPVIHTLVNRFFANLPLLNKLDLLRVIVARPQSAPHRGSSVSIIVPARNEKGNIEQAITRTPEFGTHREFIFIEGHSQDNTYEEILRVQAAYPHEDIKALQQTGKGKGNAVREAFDAATGDVLMILDADLTMPPEELPKFYDALCSRKGEFINGCRLVYPMEKNAMRFLNLLGNKFFGWFFSYLLSQRLKDTLCGTKVLYKADYEKIKANRNYFGEFDPFGDFDLLFGAAKQNLKIVEVIIRYKDREYGSTQINRFQHGMLLIKMSLFAAKKIKFI
ncbi:MAG: glycosyltransferase [Prevotellaceae bacterium]|jgi:SAM-dependent methyltransferase|nr:glycosyltransferase [Prevotellaceae bacterium]